MRSSERGKANVIEMKCLRCLVKVSRMDRDMIEAVRRRAELKMALASRVDQTVL